MMDGASLYPNGFHPSWKEMDPGLLTDARYIHRRDADGVKYYFIDFGISSVFEDATEKRLVLGMWGRDRDIPELSLTDEYDPFPVDIRILGHVYRDFFMFKYTNMEFLMPLIMSMTQFDPKARPTAEEALLQFEQIEKNLNGVGRRWVLRKKDGYKIVTVCKDVGALLREVDYTLSSYLGPTRFIVIPLPAVSLLVFYGPTGVWEQIRALSRFPGALR